MIIHKIKNYYKSLYVHVETRRVTNYLLGHFPCTSREWLGPKISKSKLFPKFFWKLLLFIFHTTLIIINRKILFRSVPTFGWLTGLWMWLVPYNYKERDIWPSDLKENAQIWSSENLNKIVILHVPRFPFDLVISATSPRHLAHIFVKPLTFFESSKSSN